MFYISISKTDSEEISNFSEKISGIIGELYDRSEVWSHLKEALLTHGLLFENLEQSQIDELKNSLTGDIWSQDNLPSTSIRLRPKDENLSNFTNILSNYFSDGNSTIQEILKKGFYLPTFEDASEYQKFKQRFEELGARFILRYIIRGQVLRVNGNPVEGVIVTAVNEVLKDEQQLGLPSETDEQGNYTISYNSNDFPDDSTGSADVTVRVQLESGELISSPTLFDADQEEIINLTVPNIPEPPEYQQVLGKIIPWLNGHRIISLSENEDDKDIVYLSGKTEINPTLIRLMIQSERLNIATPVQHPWCFYGLLRQDLPADISRLLEQPRATLENALKASHDENIIRFENDGQIQTFLQQFEEAQKEVILDLPKFEAKELEQITKKLLPLNQANDLKYTPFYGLLRQGLPPSLTQLLQQSREELESALVKSRDENIIEIQDNQIQDFLEIVSSLQDPLQEINNLKLPILSDNALISMRQLLNIALPPQEDFQAARQSVTQAYIDNLDNPLGFMETLEGIQGGKQLQTVQKLAEITQNNLLLVEDLYPQFQEQELQEIAQFSHKDWQDMALKRGIQDTKIEAIEAQVEDNFPTRFFRYRLQEQLEEQPDLTYAPELVTFLDQVNALEPADQQEITFDIRTTFLDTYLEEAPQNIQSLVTSELSGHIKRLQRLYKLTHRYAQVRALEKANFHSSQQITRLGHNVFLREHSDALGGEQAAAAIYENAQQVSAMALNLFMRYREEVKGILPAAIKPPTEDDGPTDGTGNSAMLLSSDTEKRTPRAIANLETLFGEMNLCACEHCQSIYSPAAYLVDLLEFLKDRGIRDVLLSDGRRQDIQDIELSCANTNTVVPYIDLVNEILEEAIAPSDWNKDLSIDKELGEPSVLDRYRLPESILQGRDSLAVEVLQEGKWWNIHAPTATYTAIEEQGVIKVTNRSRQTSGTTAERQAHPQYINEAAYIKLKNFNYPWTLPFDLWLEEARAYLAHLRINRHDLMRLLRTHHDRIQVEIQAQADIAAEQIGLTSTERKILNGTHRNINQPWLYWGYPSEVPQPANKSWVELLTNVRIFLERSGLEYEDLQALLKIQYINPDHDLIRRIFIGSAEGKEADTCKLSELSLFNLTAKTLEHIHYFVRLQRKLGWTIQELDQALSLLEIQLGKKSEQQITQQITNRLIESLKAQTSAEQFERFGAELQQLSAQIDGGIALSDLQQIVTEITSTDFQPPLGPGSTLRYIDDSFLVHLANIQILKSKLDLSIEHILAFWKSLNSHGGDSLYFQLFQNPNVIQSHHLEAFRLAPHTDIFGGDYLEVNAASPDTKLPQFKDTIQAAIGISDQDFSFLLDTEFKASDQDKEKDKFSYSNLSKLYRITLLAKTLNLSIRDLVTLKAFADSEKIFPFSHLQTGYVIHFIENVEKIHAAGFTASEIDYLLCHKIEQSRGGYLEDKQRLQILKELQEELKSVQSAEVYRSADWDSYDLRLVPVDKISDLPTQEASTIIVAKITNHYYLRIFDQDGERILDHKKGEFLPDKQLISELDTDFQDVIDSKKIDDLQRKRSLSEKIAVTLNFNAARKATIVQKLSNILNLNTQVASRLLTEWCNLPNDTNQLIINTFLNPDFVEADINLQKETAIPASVTIPSSVTEQADAYLRLHKVALVISRLQIQEPLLPWLFEEDIQWLNLNNLPIKTISVEDSPAKLSAWISLLNLVQLQNTLPRGAELLTSILSMTKQGSKSTEGELLNLISEQTGCRLRDLEILVGKQGYSLTFPTHYRLAHILLHLQKALAVLKQLGASAEDSLQWVKSDVTRETATSIRQTVKAKYDNDQWLDVAKSLRDPLREKQRDALVAYLLANPKVETWKDANDLYGYFLVDTEMSSCRETSRIKQAISSVQLFVQRCQLGLEQGITVNFESDDKWKQWEWMKQYRVWEANRKVFLYPENWLEPELRDDKSPIFQELENKLLQNEVTKETAEASIFQYLEELNNIARLEIMGTYHQEGKDQEILHVIGRTYNIPHTYYYRRRINSVYWTTWERIDLDIEGNHVIPVVWNNRFFLFWIIFSEQELNNVVIQNKTFDKNQLLQMGLSTSEWKMQVAWTEYRNSNWTPKKVAENCLFSHRSTKLIKETKKEGKWNEIAKKQNNIVYIDKNKKSRKIVALLPKEEDKKTFFFNIKVRENDLVIGYRREYYYPTHVAPIAIIDENTPVKITEKKKEKPIEYSYLVITTPSRTEHRSFILDKRNGLEVYVSEQEKMPKQPVHTKILDVRLEDNRPLSFRHDKNNGYEWQDFFIETLAAGSHSKTTGKLIFHLPDGDYTKEKPFFFEDHYNVLLMERNLIKERRSPKGTLISRGYTIKTFTYSLVNNFIGTLFLEGIDKLYDTSTQYLVKDGVLDEYIPRDVRNEYSEYQKIEEVSFEQNNPYSQYNWELFLHIPLSIAKHLSQNQKAAEAQQWLHYIFNPTGSSQNKTRQRYWKTKAFHKIFDERSIVELLKGLARGQKFKDFEKQISLWRKFPFSPHAIARIRATAYQKTVVMTYLDNLIAWGDQLFRRYSIESINEATQLYVLAAQILGPRPKIISPQLKPVIQTYKSIAENGSIDQFGNAAVLAQFENFASSISNQQETYTYSADSPAFGGNRFQVSPYFSVTVPYFCIPENHKFLKFWDTVEDRLFKVRHCLDIEGNARPLSLFEFPIDPSLLIKATASRLKLTDILNSIAFLPNYRFSIMVQKATELCLDLKQLGVSLLSAMEKYDAEELTLLRSTHEIQLLQTMEQVRSHQIQELVQSLSSLRDSRKVIEIRRQYYSNKEYKSTLEYAHQQLLSLSTGFQVAAQAVGLTMMSTAAFPDFYAGSAGFSGTPLFFTHAAGGQKSAESLRGLDRKLNMAASILATLAQLSSIEAGFERRWQDWKHQEKIAEQELKQIDKQISAAEIRLEIAKKELENHETQIKNAEEVKTFMESKFTNRDLYNWMISQISSVYFQSYQLAFDVAKQAEQAYRYELGKQNSETNFIQYGYWDSLKKGLLAGERLHHDLKRMEVAYLNENKRHYELTKHISLAMLDPMALLHLKHDGKCYVTLPELIFDLDYPGHFMRRIKSVSLTIPCVTGPYTNVNCTLTLIKNTVRINPQGAYAREPDDDDRFQDSWRAATKSIATSTGQNDSGLFELNFRDERYLPFEGAGAISEWQLELPGQFRQFDYDTISDVVIHLRYTALVSDALKTTVETTLQKIEQSFAEMGLGKQGLALEKGKNPNRKGLFRLFSAKRELSSQWHRFQHPDKKGDPHTMTVKLDKSRFPFLFQNRKITIEQVDLFLQPKDGQTLDKLESIQLKSDQQTLIEFSAKNTQEKNTQIVAYGETKLHYITSENRTEIVNGQDWKITLAGNSVAALEDLMLVCHYKVS